MRGLISATEITLEIQKVGVIYEQNRTLFSS